jgi:hypothetical protein
MLIDGIFLCQFRGYLGQCLVGSQSDADRQAHLALYPPMQVFAPRLQLIQLYTIEIHEALVNRIAEIGWRLLSDDAYYTASQFSVEFIVRGKDCDLLPREQLSQLKIWRTLLDAHLLSLIGTSYYATVVVRQNHDRLSLQIRPENLLT